MAKNHPRFRKGQLVIIKETDYDPQVATWIAGIVGYSKADGWSYKIADAGYTSPVPECQIRRIRKREIR